MSDGGEDVRQVQEYLHPNREHGIDWFPITMRLTVLQQQTQALQAERPDEGWRPHRQPVYRWGPDPQTVRPGGPVGRGDRGVADLHPEPPGIDPQLRRTVPAGGDDQHGVGGVDDPSGGEPAVCEEAADAVDAERSALAVTDTDEDPQ
jgi:hypothetical protein